MERLLLLWDELDELYGAAYHLVAALRHDVGTASRGALDLVNGWAGAAQSRVRLALRGSFSGT